MADINKVMNINIEDVAEIMGIDIAQLAQKQHDVFKEHLLSVVDKIRIAIEKEDIKYVSTFESRSGDGWGDDNTCINFSYKSDDTMDIEEAFEVLKRLTRYTLEAKKNDAKQK